MEQEQYSINMIQVTTGKLCSLLFVVVVVVTGQPKRRADMAQTNLIAAFQLSVLGSARVQDIMSPDGRNPFKGHETEPLSTGKHHRLHNKYHT